MTRATPKARYDQITVLGMLKKAMTAEKFSKLPLMTIPFLSRLPPISCPGDVIKCYKGRNDHKTLSTMEPGKVEIGAEILLRIRREVGKSIEWLLTG
jgi:hypothetical protein